MKIEILVYKFEIQKEFFILNIPKEISDLGYETECYGCDSMLFDGEDAYALQDKGKGIYKLICETLEELTFEKIKNATEEKDSIHYCFSIVGITKIEIS